MIPVTLGNKIQYLLAKAERCLEVTEMFEQMSVVFILAGVLRLDVSVSLRLARSCTVNISFSDREAQKKNTRR